MCCIETDYQNVSPHERREMRTMSLRSSGLAVPCVPVPARGTKSQTPISKARPKEQPVEAPLLERSQEIQKILLIVLL
jgi:hypothetical protein